MSDVTVKDPIAEELAGLWTEPPAEKPAHDPLDPADQGPSLEEQLDVSKPVVKAAPKSQDLDKTHSKAAGGRGYCVTVEGEYYAKSTETKGHVIKTYSLKFNLPSLTNERKEAALGIIIGASRPGGGMLKKALRNMDPLSSSYRTHTITKVEVLNGAPEPFSLQYMTLENLQKFVREDPRVADFPLSPEEYWDVDHLREDIIDFITNKTTEVVNPTTGESTKGGFGLKKTPAARIEERHAIRIEEHELALMNPGLE